MVKFCKQGLMNDLFILEENSLPGEHKDILHDSWIISLFT